MKIALAQSKAARGDFEKNINQHVKLIEKASQCDADLIVFSELSITGYEPSMAKELAFKSDDRRLDIFQSLSNQLRISIVIGLPLSIRNDVVIGAIKYKPNLSIKTLAKQHLHEDEKSFFKSVTDNDNIIYDQPKIGLAICYELSVIEHNQKALDQKVNIYLASVAKTEKGRLKACQHLSTFSKTNSIISIMVNSTGLTEEGYCAGGSAIWNDKGKLLDQLNNESKGLLIYDYLKGSISHKLHLKNLT